MFYLFSRSTYLFGSGEQQQQAAAFIRCRLITQTQVAFSSVVSLFFLFSFWFIFLFGSNIASDFM